MTDYLWGESPLTGIVFIDDEHEEIFSTLAAWLKGPSANNPQPTSNEIQRLVDVWIKHFRQEEALLVRHNYPGLDKQKADHLSMERKIRQFFSKAAGEPISAADIDALLKMFIAHTLGPDMAYSEFQKGEGVR
ncbi:MAG: hypothetical protein IT292_10630 [Deltaproteobacteria bacterium]|nr:hypothetical protein [Deltaproteobacteria bacterium]